MELDYLVGLTDTKLSDMIIDLRREYDHLTYDQLKDLEAMTEEFMKRGKRDQPIFVYGTLADPNVQQWLWFDKYKGVDAILEGYEKKTYSNGIHYVVPNTDKEVKGKLYHITQRQLTRADMYETRMYKRVQAKVKVQGAYVPAMVYAQNEKYFERFDEQ